MQEKQKKTSGVSLHSFPGAYKIFFGRKMARKEQLHYSAQILSIKQQVIVFSASGVLRQKFFGQRKNLH